jgi:RimJ/RimL family protein N-acetyltransferase
MPFDFQDLSERLERVYSRRLALRPVSLADAWPLFHATRNPLFNKHLLWDQPDDEHDVIKRIDVIIDASRRGRMTALSGVVKATGEWTSLFRFQPYGGDPRAMEMGIWMHDRFWHGRYSLELGRLCVDAAFDHADVDRLVGAAAPENRGSCHLMKSVGMSDSKLVTRATETGRPVVLQEFEILRSDWCARRRGGAEAASYASIPWQRQGTEVLEARTPQEKRLTDRVEAVAEVGG